MGVKVKHVVSQKIKWSQTKEEFSPRSGVWLDSAMGNILVHVLAQIILTEISSHMSVSDYCVGFGIVLNSYSI